MILYVSSPDDSLVPFLEPLENLGHLLISAKTEIKRLNFKRILNIASCRILMARFVYAFKSVILNLNSNFVREYIGRNFFYSNFCVIEKYFSRIKIMILKT